MKSNLPESVQDQLDAATFRRFLEHLDKNKDVQNIDLMILADFCRNCLSKWYLAEAEARGVSVTDEEARERVYGMPYEEWKKKYQTPATEEQMQAYQVRKAKKSS
ncbi:MAG: DUF1244 domain-containing protein [Flavobacteriales bacterium]|nr:DUF1244 domain-containing protein [Flavobacteriales bacterium]